MSQPPFSAAALRGAVDLSSLAAASQRRTTPGAAGPAGATSGATSPYVVDVTEADFQALVLEQSLTVPVVVDLWTPRAPAGQQLGPMLEKLAAEFAGRFLLARVNIDTAPALVQAFQVQTLPFVVAVVKAQPIPLVADLLPEAELRAVLDKLLEVAAQNGVTGRLAAPDGAGGPGEDGDLAAVVEPPLPPLHQAAYDAIEADDLAAAAAAYEQAVRENPSDDLAAVGLANVQLMQRTQDLDPERAVAAADAAPDDHVLALAAADAELVLGQVTAAFDRLVAAVRVTSGPERDEVRRRLLDLFAIVGPDDPEVRRARIALTNALF